ncbi:MAG TPA: HAMP domain-containing protein, partial [Thermoanaerobaculia bacterium]|nr:HAMP domain-containing protein [Thermoanaerobaculia bacterium]
MSAPSPEPNPGPTAKRRPRLLWTLLGAMVLVGLLPLVVSHYFLIGINRDSLETLEKKYLTRSAVQIASALENLLNSNRQQLSKIAGSIRMMDKALPEGADAFTYAAQSQWVGDYMTPDSDLIALRVLNIEGRGAEAVPTNLDPAIIKEMEIARDVALQGHESTGPITHVSATNTPAVVMAVPVKDGEATVGAVVGLVSLRRIVDSLREEGKGDVTAFIVDRDGRVLLHSEPAVEVQHPNFSHLKLVQEFSKARVPLRLTESYEDKGVKLLGTVAPAPPSVGVIVQKPEARAFGSVDEMIRATVQWGAIALVLAIGAAILFASGIARPIRALAERSREIAQGNYQQRLELKTHNEIGDLAQNFNVMSESIERAVEQLKKAAHENHLLFL